jgi:predicted dehydrogenase
MRKVKLGIIGVGNMGSQHATGIWNSPASELEVSAVADINPDRLEWTKAAAAEAQSKNPERNIPTPATFTDASEMLKSGLCEAVIVATPHYDHPRYAIEAFKCGLHVMCEKPAGVYTAQVREMMAEADKHPELKFGMMFNQRTNCVYRKMREIMQSGELGEIRRTSWIITNWYRPQAYYNSGTWRATWSGEGGGVLLNQAPHNLDLWQWICGMPCKIDAKMHMGKWHDIEVEDDVTAYVEYPNGATGTFVTTTGDAPGANRFEIVCDGGTLICENDKLIMHKLGIFESEHTKVNKELFAGPPCKTVQVETDGKNPQHEGVREAFAAAILRNEPMIADGREGINGLTISNAMHLSAWTNKTIELPLDENLFYELLMERVKTSRRKENVVSVVADLSGTYNS